MAGDLKNIDAVCEILDARIPRASRNPELDKLCRDKKRIIVLNRADQADPALTALWAEYYQKRGFTVIATDSEKGGFGKAFESAVKKCCADIIARNEAKGQIGKMMRLMIVGIPNVGKSSFINRLLGKKAAVAANKPGVTRGNQWYSLLVIPFILLYSGKRGKVNTKYFFYIFYPAHLAILQAIAWII